VKSLNMAFAIVLLFSTTGLAQTRTRRTPPRRTTSPPATSQLETTRNNAARIQLAGLNKDLTRFLYVYGRLSKDLELTIADPQSADAANQTRTGLINSLHVMSGRLDQIERQFRFTAGLDRHYRTLQGVSSKGAQAESAASAGRFDQAGRILIEVAAQLTDVLIEM
jgi:hypothetical protein